MFIADKHPDQAVATQQLMLSMKNSLKHRVNGHKLFFQILPIVHLAMSFSRVLTLFFKCNIYLIDKSTTFDNDSFRSERNDRVLLWGWGVRVMLSLMSAWWFHNHRSRCWAMIRRAVSSLKGQKSIQPHYRAASMSISPPDTLHWLSHTHTPPANTKWYTFKWTALYDEICDTLECRKIVYLELQ